MTQAANPRHCATCPYRQPAGLISITRRAHTRTEPACLTCAAEALTHYATQPAETARFTADGPNELCC